MQTQNNPQEGKSLAAMGARRLPVGKEEIDKATTTLKEYKDKKVDLERRILENEQWYAMRHWETIRKSTNPGDPEPASAWLFHCIVNKHADAMDNYPEPNVLPREESDRGVAKQLSSILPAVLDQNAYEQTYSDVWWYKLKTGTGVTGVFWSSSKNRGIGDIDIRRIDLLNLFWQPGVTDIQKSRNLFHVEIVDNEVLEQAYPHLVGKLSNQILDVKQYRYGHSADTTDKSAVVDWYYKRRAGGRDVLHYCKFCAGEVLFASENEPEYAQTGYYSHGLYPFVFDTLFPQEGTPAGFGYVDVCKSPQLYIDKLDQVILKNAVTGARPRYFVRGETSINMDDLRNVEQDYVRVAGSGDIRENMMPVDTKPLAEIYVAVREKKIEEMKETSNNREFNAGGTASGVTAASAIAALQEAGSKSSRDMIKSSYRAFARINQLCIELMRQFYTEPRYFRILGEQGMEEFVQFTNRGLREQAMVPQFGLEMGMREPVLDIVVTSQKSSPFATAAQNERAKELYNMGFFNPQLADQAAVALDMMDFEGIDKVRQHVMRNGMLLQQVQMLAQQVMQLAQIVDAQNGTTITQGVAAQLQGGSAGGTEGPHANTRQDAEMETNALGRVLGENAPLGGEHTAAKARVRAATAATPRV